ncbi:MAG: hypothetical protein RL094_532 [Candidatus Parcubacteria bacterium]|jgi:ATPase subunit of ABC transporter with duplicated ATPase domains
MSIQNKPIISSTNVCKSYETFPVLKNINLSIQKGEKIGLVGPNGSGKSTLLRILSAQLQQDEGIVTLSPKITIGYIPQEFSELNSSTVEDFIGTVLAKDAIEKVFKKLNLSSSILNREIGTLSGGEKTKVALTRIMMAKQDILLLDEPTNNLDIAALSFLEDYIKKSSKTFLIISHDRAFLDATVSRIFEIDEFEKNLHVYEGNYSSYIQERTARLERAWEAYSDDVEKRGHIEEIIDQKLRRAVDIGNAEPRDNDKNLYNFKVRQGQTAYQQGAKRLGDRLERMEEIEKPKEPLPLNVRFYSEERSGDKVFDLKDVTKKLPHHTLGPINLTINYGDRVLFTGPNGIGKTTLIKMLLGTLTPTSGMLVKGARLHIGYLPQVEDVLPDATVRDEFLRLTELEEGIARKTLHRFKISAEDVNKKISELSSGERSRFILAVLMCKNVNCIILDEPSNHLDFEVLESLEEALKEYEGTLIVVSHDRYFIERMGNLKVVAIGTSPSA